MNSNFKLNPYSSPAPTTTSNELRPHEIANRRLSLLILLASVLISIFYTFVDEVVLGTAFGAWPMLLITAAIALACSFLTRDWLIAPLCCFCGTMFGGIVVGLVRGWEYAQLEFCLPLALVFSIPALVVAALLFNQERQEIQQAQKL